MLLLCSRQSILWQSRFRADAVLVSLLNGECVLYDAVAIVLFTSLEKHIDENTDLFLTLDILRLLFSCSLAHSRLALFRVHGLLVFHHAENLSLFYDYEIVAVCLSAYLTFALAQFWGFVWDRVPLLPSVLAGKGVSAVAVLHGRRFPVTVQRPIPCTTSPLLQAFQFPRWFAVLDTLTTYRCW